MRNLFERFRRDEGGNVLMLFGLAMVPLIGIMGASVDYAIASQKQTRLQTALDQAGLAVAKEPQVSDEATVSRIKADDDGASSPPTASARTNGP